MSRTCPSCHTAIPYIRGVDTRRPETRNTPWWQMARRRFYCRSCGVQLRAVPTVVGYSVIILMIVAALLNFLVLNQGLINMSALALADLAAFAVLVACDIRWGHTIRLHHAL